MAFCRFADDCNIFVGSRKAAERVMNSISHYIEKCLKLVVNRDKSQVAPSDRVKFLGMTIVHGTIAISKQAMAKAMAQVKALTPRGTYLSLENTMENINRWYRGWANYFAMTQYPAQLQRIEAHIRRRLRSRLIGQQKNQRNLFRKLAKRGVPRHMASKVYSNHKRWVLSNSMAVTRAYPNKFFVNELGQLIGSNLQLPHWFEVNRWIKLP